MARTPLAEQLTYVMATVSEARRRALPVEDVLDERRTTRRRFLHDAGAAAAAAGAVTAFGRFASPARAAASPEIVVVGAGLAGLTCAYRLLQAGMNPQVYEASNRVGGRCWTLRDYFAGGQIAERGGELIDTGHHAIRSLAQELKLKLDNLLRAEPNGTEPFYFFGGDPYTILEASQDMNAIWQKLHRDLSEASFPTLFDSFTERGAELDAMSIVDWIDESVPGGMSSKLGQLLAIAYAIEYGADPDEQASLNLLYLLGYAGQGKFRIFGASNEKYHVRGGNDQIPQILAAKLGSRVSLEHELEAIELSGGTYTLTFDTGPVVTADHVVLALPFSILRSSVDFSNAGFQALKVTAINEQGMGSNSKLHLQFSTRLWNELGCNGDTYADTGYQATWEVTRAQPGERGILVDYTGGSVADAPPTSGQFLSQLEPVLDGITDEANGLEHLDVWRDHEWTKGSYSFYKVGQYTKFAGMEGRRQGNCHFAGEHAASQDFQGYLNGAVESGERAAAEVLADLK